MRPQRQSSRLTRLVTALGVAALGGALLPAQVATQAPSSKPSRTAVTIPRTSDGKPSLDGAWSFATSTPLERPKQFEGKPVLTDAEAKAFLAALPSDGCRIINCESAQGNLESAYGAEWWNWGDRLADNRTSLIIDPPSGKIPPLTDHARQTFALRAGNPFQIRTDNPEDRMVQERCIVGFNAGPPLTPSAYNNNIQIVQSRDHIAITNEMVHSTRIIPVKTQPRLPESLALWHGDVQGRWDGDTFVIETRNFRKEAQPRSLRPDSFVLVERYTRRDAKTLVYEYTMNDPTTWTKPWTVQIPMVKLDELIYEYACHEGNHAMEHMLKGARAEDKRAGER